MGVQTDVGHEARGQILVFMRTFVKNRHYVPTVGEISAYTGIARTGVVWHLEKMREHGDLDYEDGNMSRSLRLL